VGSWNCGGIAISDVVRAAIRLWVSGTQLSWTALRVTVAIIKAGRPSGSGNLRRYCDARRTVVASRATEGIGCGGMMFVVDLTDEDRSDLRSLVRGEGYGGSVSARARIVLWRAAGHSVREIARMAETTRPTVYKWIKRYVRYGIEGLTDRVATGRSPKISTQVRATILALSRQSPPERTGLSYWSSREMARYLQREMGVSVSHNFVAALWREHDIQPPRQQTVNPSTDRTVRSSVSCLST
jgi:transposase